MSHGPRVVSLLPSVTETLREWGIDPVACTRFCEQPDLAHVGGTKDPDVAGIVALRPDLVVLDEEENRREDAEALAGAGLAVHTTAVRSVADVAPTLGTLAARLGVAGLGAQAPLPAPAATSSAFVPIWRRPWMTIGADTYGSSLLATIGVANVYGDASERYPTIHPADVAARRPDRVLAPSEPYPFGPRHHDELAVMGEVVFVDGRDLFWWGTRTPAAMARLAAQLGPPGR